MIMEKTTLTIKITEVDGKKLREILEEIQKARKDHPDIIINIEADWV